jgi:metal-responsive CopG/Arc/MetJ family transcriptional regulator
MKTIQMTIDDRLLREVDAEVTDAGTTRSAFIRDALLAAIRRRRLAEFERSHAEGWRRHPSDRDESDEWAPEQAWGAE